MTRGYVCHAHGCTKPAAFRTPTWPYYYACAKHTIHDSARTNGAMWIALRSPQDPNGGK